MLRRLLSQALRKEGEGIRSCSPQMLEKIKRNSSQLSKSGLRNMKVKGRKQVDSEKTKANGLLAS
jgi:hypothetical protein